MNARTRTQEMKFHHALGYSWGRKDAVKSAATDEDRRILVLSSDDFAHFYAVYEEKTNHHMMIEDAFAYFIRLSKEEQQAYASAWRTLSYNPYTPTER